MLTFRPPLTPHLWKPNTNLQNEGPRVRSLSPSLPLPFSPSHSPAHSPAPFPPLLSSDAHLCLFPLLPPGVSSLPLCLLSFRGSSFAQWLVFSGHEAPGSLLPPRLSKQISYTGVLGSEVLAKLKDQVLTSNTPQIILPQWDGETLWTISSTKWKENSCQN